MKCNYCDYETESLNESDSVEELERHMIHRHPESCISENQTLTILELHHKYKVDIGILVEDFFLIRSKLSDEFKKRELKQENWN